jgi:hypothetical protein
MDTSDIKHGSCLCGAVTYEVDGALRPVVACHCIQCRKQTGHYMAATGAGLARFRLTKDNGLKWYRASEAARRGFCGTCGSTLFWQSDGADYIAIAAGTLDDPTGLEIEGHIFCDFKGDYYSIEGGKFQLGESGHTVAVPD